MMAILEAVAGSGRRDGGKQKVWQGQGKAKIIKK